MARRTTTTTPDLHGHVHVHPSLLGLFRQDGLKLWQWDGSSEALLHDVDLAAGDTLPLTLTSWNTDIIITDIDSFLKGTEWRKRFALANSWSPNMIEGIGSMHGPFEPVSNFFDRGYMIACFGLDTLGYFPAPGPSCALAISIGAKATEVQQLSAFPNRASNELVVTFPGELTKVQ